jgi:hypothetical protein
MTLMSLRDYCKPETSRHSLASLCEDGVSICALPHGRAPQVVHWSRLPPKEPHPASQEGGKGGVALAGGGVRSGNGNGTAGDRRNNLTATNYQAQLQAIRDTIVNPDPLNNTVRALRL